MEKICLKIFKLTNTCALRFVLSHDKTEKSRTFLSPCQRPVCYFCVGVIFFFLNPTILPISFSTFEALNESKKKKLPLEVNVRNYIWEVIWRIRFYVDKFMTYTYIKWIVTIAGAAWSVWVWFLYEQHKYWAINRLLSCDLTCQGSTSVMVQGLI